MNQLEKIKSLTNNTNKLPKKTFAVPIPSFVV